MSKSVIAIDIDDVLGDELGAIRRFFNEHTGAKLTAEDYLVEGEYWGYWHAVWGVDEARGREIYKAYVKQGSKYGHTPLSGAIDAIQRLKKKYKLVVITARGDVHVAATTAWLKTHFEDAFHAVEFMPLWGDRHVITKAEIAAHHGAAYLIDDNFEHCELALKAGIRPLLFGSYGWNKTKAVPEGMVRVADWAAIMEYFDAPAGR